MKIVCIGTARVHGTFEEQCSSLRVATNRTCRRFGQRRLFSVIDPRAAATAISHLDVILYCLFLLQYQLASGDRAGGAEPPGHDGRYQRQRTHDGRGSAGRGR
jgi:hypothetical protein